MFHISVQPCYIFLGIFHSFGFVYLFWYQLPFFAPLWPRSPGKVTCPRLKTLKSSAGSETLLSVLEWWWCKNVSAQLAYSPLFWRFPEKLVRLGHGATPQFATNSARVTADIYLPACICTQIHNYKHTNTCTNTTTTTTITQIAPAWQRTYICQLILHYTAERVIYSRNIGEIAANRQIPAQL